MKQSVISYVPMAERYDVLVLGGGTAGVMAACAAGREGKKALILEREYALGGTATLSLTIPRMTNHIPGFVSNSSLAEELQQTLEAKKRAATPISAIRRCRRWSWRRCALNTAWRFSMARSWFPSSRRKSRSTR